MYNKLLKTGASGREVVSLQFYLNKILMPTTPTLLDGKFGSGTKKLVKKYQAQFGLFTDGEVGSKTWESIKLQNTKKAYRKPLKFSNKCVDIAHLQNALNKLLNLSPKMSLDGRFGPDTDRYVREFQARLSLGIDGIVGRDTWLTIEQLLTNKIAIMTLNFIQNSMHDLRKMLVPRGDTPWMKYAIQEKDSGKTHEEVGSKNNPRIIEYHSTTTLKAQSDEVPWCSSFVNWAIIKSGHKGTNSAAANSWLKWGKKVSSTPGAIIIIHNSGAANSSLTRSGNHVGFLLSETEHYFSILGGNQRDQVKESKYPKRSWKVKGYRLPN